MIYTASFAQVTKIGDKVPIAVSNGLPKWYHGARYKKLAPPFDLVRLFRTIEHPDEDDQAMYITSYVNNVLQHLDPKEVEKDLMALTNGKDAVLLTQEASNEFSHRHIIRLWLQDAGINSEEIVR